MASNRYQQLTAKSSILKPLIFILITLAILTKPTIQQSVIPATCTYSFDTATGFYTCRLTSGVISAPTDVLNITGTHQAGRADSDVKIVWYPANNMFYLNGDILKKFENLVIFKLDSIALQEIAPDAFDYCPNLEQFVSKLSNLTTYPPQMMKSCQKLKVFKSIEQELTDIPELFGNITSLEEVDLSDNRLLSISENLVKNMPNLRIFNVQDNRLTQLPNNFFENCPNLEEVEVSNNRFNDSTMITRGFNGNTNLKKLGLDAFGIANFDFQFFSQFAKLDMLNIGITFLTQISWQSLPSSLTVLKVESIAEEIPENSLNHLVNLSTLSLSGSGITNLHKDTFKAQTELKVLSIEWTSLTSLHPELFTNQGNLIDLNLRYNKIEGLPVGIFVPLVNLGMTNYLYGINMYSNKIKRLNKISFGDHPHLKYLDFGNNQIDSIQSGIFSKFNSSIYRANFVGNVCVSKQFTNAVNLDADEDLKWCFDSWEGITTTSTTTTSTTRAPPTTPGGAGNNFKKIEIFVILLIGFVGILINFI